MNLVKINSLPQVQGKYRENFDLSNSNWFSVGGKVDVLFKPKSAEDLQFFLQNCPKESPVKILGAASNVIIRDGGIRGVLIKLGREFSQISIENGVIEVGSACLNANFVRFCQEHVVSDFEFLIGIPGSLGGAVAMNAGCYGAEIADYLIAVEGYDENGEFCRFSKEDMNFSYRRNGLKKQCFFTKVFLKASEGDINKINARINEIMLNRENSQPLKTKTGGSTFKNPVDEKAWKLIDEANCRGLVHGGAKISEKHCNFMINFNDASAKDLEELGEIVREKVKRNSGIELEWEIKIIGEKL